MTVDDILLQLEQFGSEQTKKVLTRHGAREPFFGVKVADLKTIVKKVGKNHELSIALYDTGNSDAMYLAGLIADETKITRAQLEKWADQAYWYMIADYTVAWVAAESPHGWELGLEWINSDREMKASAGWSTLSSCLSIYADEQIDQVAVADLLEKVKRSLHDAPNRVRYSMNQFVIAAGSFVPAFTQQAKEVADSLGMVRVDMGGTACKVPEARTYIEKVEQRGNLGKKKKMARC